MKLNYQNHISSDKWLQFTVNIKWNKTIEVICKNNTYYFLKSCQNKISKKKKYCSLQWSKHAGFNFSKKKILSQKNSYRVKDQNIQVLFLKKIKKISSMSKIKTDRIYIWKNIPLSKITTIIIFQRCKHASD